jgi:FKBP-type peptidyl-prolyl cis-trans isomerase
MVTTLLVLSSSLGSPYRYDIEKGVGMDAKSKTCSRCDEEKSLDEFSRDKRGKYGRDCRCKLCMRKYRQDNKEKMAARFKQYYQKNRKKIIERSKRYRQDNKEKRAAYLKQYEQNNKEKLSEYHRQYRQANKEKKRQYYQDNEEYRTRRKLSCGLRRSLKNVGKTKKAASALSYIGCTIEFMQEHLNSTKKPDWDDNLHIDHIIPSSLFDHTNEEEVKKCWNWRNLRYLPAKENTSKQDSLDMDLIKSYGIEGLLPEGVDK